MNHFSRSDDYFFHIDTWRFKKNMWLPSANNQKSFMFKNQRSVEKIDSYVTLQQKCLSFISSKVNNPIHYHQSPLFTDKDNLNKISNKISNLHLPLTFEYWRCGILLNLIPGR